MLPPSSFYLPEPGTVAARLGFDTATTIGLLTMTTAASLAGVPPVSLLALPLAFAAAMTLCDSLNGLAMMRMYQSALRGRRAAGRSAARFAG